MKSKLLNTSLFVFFIFSFNTLLAHQEDITKKNRKQIEIVGEGDTIIHLPYEHHNFGEIYNKAPIEQENRDLNITVDADKQNFPKRRKRSATSSSTQFDASNPIAEIPYNSANSPTGAKTYNIPIITATGFSNIPQISLAYNSQAGNGNAGMGWNISGLSAIHIVPKNLYYDNEISLINLSHPETYSFSLDGVRLIKNEGNLSEIFTYETAQGFILVKPHISNKKVSHFEVKFPNGSTGIFGLEEKNLLAHNYPISSLVDALGFRIDFEYFESGNNYYVSKIRYGSKEKAAHIASIDFQYEEREDFISGYILGKRTEQNKILKKIVSSSENQELRTYSLTHNNTSGINFLSKLDSKAGGLTLNPLQFKYGEGSYTSTLSISAEEGDTNIENKYLLERGFLVKNQPLLMSSNFSNVTLETVRGKFVKDRTNEGLISLPVYSTYTQRKKRTTKKRHLAF